MRISERLKESLSKTGWLKYFEEYFSSEEYSNLIDFINQDRMSGIEVYPRPDQVFRAFEETPFDKVKCVIVGQDPYHSPGAANGLAFSVNKGIAKPPTLRNIVKELERDLKVFIPEKSVTLDGWASQGVLLLNSVLTVRKGEAASHANKGWEAFTDLTIKALVENNEKLVFVIWGGYAQSKLKKIPFSYRYKHKFIDSAHPSPLSAHRGFFGSKPFSQVNAFLEKNGLGVIDWTKIERSDFGQILDLPEWTKEDEVYERIKRSK